jgi:F0F1-type ATP synthase membrane subunit b/b'
MSLQGGTSISTAEPVSSSRRALHKDLWTPVADLAGEFQQEADGLEHLVDDLFNELDAVRERLAAEAEALADARRELALREQKLAEERRDSAALRDQLQAQQSDLQAALAELRELRRQLAGGEVAAVSSVALPPPASLEPLQTELEGQRELLSLLLDELQQMAKSVAEKPSEPQEPAFSSLWEQFVAEQQVMQAKFQAELQTRITDLANRLAELSTPPTSEAPAASDAFDEQLAELAREIQQTRTELASAVRDAQSASLAAVAEVASLATMSPATPPGEEVAAQARISEELKETRRERERLEAELELVRTRAAEIQKATTRQNREFTRHREGLVTEIRDLREFMAKQLELHLAADVSVRDSQSVRKSSSKAVSKAAPKPEPVAEPSPPADPLANSVMAQFARLQRDVAARRKKK